MAGRYETGSRPVPYESSDGGRSRPPFLSTFSCYWFLDRLSSLLNSGCVLE